MKTIRVGGVQTAIFLNDEKTMGGKITEALTHYHCVIFQHADPMKFEVVNNFMAVEAFAKSYEIERISKEIFKFKHDDDLVNFYLQLEQA